MTIVAHVVSFILLAVCLFILLAPIVKTVAERPGNVFGLDEDEPAGQKSGRRWRGWVSFVAAAAAMVWTWREGVDPRAALFAAFVATLLILPPSKGRAYLCISLAIVGIVGMVIEFDFVTATALFTLVGISVGDWREIKRQGRMASGS